MAEAASKNHALTEYFLPALMHNVPHEPLSALEAQQSAVSDHLLALEARQHVQQAYRSFMQLARYMT